MTILSNQGWIELNPHIRVATPPLKGEPSRTEVQNHESMEKGWYTDQEILAWERLLEFPVYHEAKLKELSWGACLSTGVCQNTGTAEGVSRYDLQHLIQEETASWNPFDKILAKIHQYGDVMALGVIIWIGFRLIIDVTMIGLTMLKEGPQAAAALMVNLYLNTQIQYKKIQKRNKNLRKKIKEEEEMIELA